MILPETGRLLLDIVRSLAVGPFVKEVLVFFGNQSDPESPGLVKARSRASAAEIL